MGIAAVTVTRATIFRTGSAILIITAGIIAAEGTFPTILRTGLAGFSQDTLVIAAEGQLPVTNRAVLKRLINTYIIPGTLTAEGIDRADEINALKVVAARVLVDVAATASTFSTIIGAGFAGLGVTTDSITTDIGRDTSATVETLNLVDAEIVPVHVAAVRICCANAGLNALLFASGIAIGVAAISVARATLISLCRAEPVPLHIAAVWVHCANAALNTLIGAALGAVGQAATALAASTIFRTIGAGFIVATDLVPAADRTFATVCRAGRTIFIEECFTRVVAAALTTICRAGLAVLFTVTDVVATLCHNLANAACQVRDLGNTETIPCHLTTEGIGLAYARFNITIHAAGSRVGFAALAIARAALIGLGGAKLIPNLIATEDVYGTDTILNQRVHTAWSSIGDTAATFAVATVRRTVGAVLAVITDIISAIVWTLTAVCWAGITVFPKQSLAGIVAAAITAIFRAGFAVFIVATTIVPTESAFPTVLRAEFATLKWVTSVVATYGTFAAVLGTVETSFRLDTDIVTAATDTATVAATIFFDFSYANIIPCSFAAKGIKFTNAHLNCRVSTTRSITRLTATNWAIATVARASLAIFCRIAEVIATLRALATVCRASFAGFCFITKVVATFWLDAAHKGTLSHRLLNADIVPHVLTTECVKGAGTGFNRLISTAGPFLNDATVTTFTTIARASLAGLSIVTNVIATITTYVFSANTLTVVTEVSAGAFVTIITGDIREGSVDTAAIRITHIVGARVAVITTAGRAKALAVDANVHIGAGVTVITRHAIHLARYLTNACSSIAKARFTLAQSIG
jgi:hypothetical protein